MFRALEMVLSCHGALEIAIAITIIIIIIIINQPCIFIGKTAVCTPKGISRSNILQPHHVRV